ncbi:hypothetical protein [Bacillus sp. P14.5]|uniref:hypothetical protein n=1 Tax=Bacillus sp. P14.5 TaxID=1983400 RepID=UPI0013B050E9|nr:hypothetical protein [Bacillus sp. P14.5]
MTGKAFQTIGRLKSGCDIHHYKFVRTPRHDKKIIGILIQDDENDFKIGSTFDSKPFVNVSRFAIVISKT